MTEQTVPLARHKKTAILKMNTANYPVGSEVNAIAKRYQPHYKIVDYKHEPL